ncbi:uncharacterized protein C6orf118-like [Centroberyx gerrardi]|uniref:uncharacterized protein C6orf118-like n=1 Tax=Centroberyx gerrardi TaxID=166262 RepID=UPI003AAF24E2
MSSSSKPKPRCCDMQRDVHRLLLAAEAGHKADVLTYCSGHLGPRSLTQRQPHNNTKQSFWRTSHSGEETLQQRQTAPPANVKKKEMKDSLSEFTAAAALEECKVWGPRREEAADSSSPADRKEEASPPKMVLSTSNSLLVKPRTLAQTKPPSSEEEGQQSSQQVDPTKKDQLKMMQRFGRQVVGKQGLWEWNCLAGRKVAEMHEKKLQQELKKLSAQRWPSRDRLAVFSDVFDDVCEGSPIFGRILREIKTDYDLYLNYIMASQSSVQDMSLNTPHEELDNGTVRAEELEEAEKEVLRLEEEARRALEENIRVRRELQSVSGSEDRDPALWQDDGTVFVRRDGVQSMRLQVWNVWKEIQQLEKEIEEKMVSATTTTATQRRIRDSKTEIMRLIASNDRLKTINKDLENNINMVLNREKASKALRQYV